MLNAPPERQRLHEELARGVKNAAHRAVGDRAIEAFFEQALTEGLRRGTLDAVVAGAKCSAHGVWVQSVDLLFRLAERYPAACDAILEILTKGRANERWQIVASLGFAPASHRLERPFVGAVLRRSMTDKSAKVRQFTCDRVEMLEFRDLLPQIAELACRDSNEKVRRAADHSARMLRDGFFIDDARSDADQVFVWMKRDGGGRSAVGVPRSALERLGPDCVYKALQRAGNNLPIREAEWNAIVGRRGRCAASAQSTGHLV